MNTYYRKTIDNGEKPFYHYVPHGWLMNKFFYLFFYHPVIRIFIYSIVLCHSKLEQIHWFNELILIIPIWQINTLCILQYVLVLL